MAEEEEIVETDPYCTSDRFAAKNGIKAIEVGEDYSVCIMPIDETCLNGISIPMGGCYFTLGDFSFGVASHYIKNNMVTMNSQIDFIASAQVGDTITARCELVPCTSKKIARYEITMNDQNGKLLALMHVTGYRRSHHQDKGSLTEYFERLLLRAPRLVMPKGPQL